MLTGMILTVLSVFVPAEQRNRAKCVHVYMHVTENERAREERMAQERRNTMIVIENEK